MVLALQKGNGILKETIKTGFNWIKKTYFLLPIFINFPDWFERIPNKGFFIGFAAPKLVVLKSIWPRLTLKYLYFLLARTSSGTLDFLIVFARILITALFRFRESFSLSRLKHNFITFSGRLK